MKLSKEHQQVLHAQTGEKSLKINKSYKIKSSLLETFPVILERIILIWVLFFFFSRLQHINQATVDNSQGLFYKTDCFIDPECSGSAAFNQMGYFRGEGSVCMACMNVCMCLPGAQLHVHGLCMQHEVDFSMCVHLLRWSSL